MAEPTVHNAGGWPYTVQIVYSEAGTTKNRWVDSQDFWHVSVQVLDGGVVCLMLYSAPGQLVEQFMAGQASARLTFRPPASAGG